ncbi:MAG: tetratricopeptide repeat protein, partial [Bacteroidota bacterium]
MIKRQLATVSNISPLQLQPSKKYQILIPVLFLMLVTNSFPAKSAGLDSLSYANKIDSLLLVCRKVSRKPDSLKIVGQQLLDIGKASRQAKGLYEGHFALGFSNQKKGTYLNAINHFDSAITILNKDRKRLFSILFRVSYNKALAQRFQGDLKASTKTLKGLGESAKEYQNPTLLSRVYNQLGVNERRNSKFETAISYYLKSLNIIDSLGTEREKLFVFINLANIYGQMTNYEESNAMNRKAIKIAEANKQGFRRPDIENNIGLNFINMKQYDSALFYLNKALKYYQSQGQVPKINLAYQNVAAVMTKLGNYDSAAQLFKTTLDHFQKSKNALRTLES